MARAAELTKETYWSGLRSIVFTLTLITVTSFCLLLWGLRYVPLDDLSKPDLFSHSGLGLLDTSVDVIPNVCLMSFLGTFWAKGKRVFNLTMVGSVASLFFGLLVVSHHIVKVLLPEVSLAQRTYFFNWTHLALFTCSIALVGTLFNRPIIKFLNSPLEPSPEQPFES